MQVQTWSIRPDRLGAVELRADSPMREESSSLNGSTLNGGRPSGLPLITQSFTKPAPNGFTAVNGIGEPHRNISLPAIQPSSDPITLPKVEYRGQGLPDPNPFHQPPGWRPQDGLQSIEQNAERPVDNPETNKRKRAESLNAPSGEQYRDGHPHGVTPCSPKRRITTHDGNGPSPEPPFSDENGLADNPTSTYERVTTPVVNGGSPPPQPDPKVSAAIAQTFLGHQQYGAGHTARRSSSPANEQGDGENQNSQASAGEQAHVDDNDPTKKGRKRNFSNRTKTGCHTCRSRKKKCDEGKPTCNNCIRGSFACGGYGAKPPNGAKLTAGRPVPLQAKQHYEAPHGPPQYFDRAYHEGHPRSLPSYNERFSLPRPDVHEPPVHRYAGSIPPIESRPPHEREVWPPPRPQWHSNQGTDHPSHSILHQTLPPADYSAVPAPPPHSFAPLPPPPTEWPAHPPSAPASWPPRPHPPAVINTHGSVVSDPSSSHRGQFMLAAGKEPALPKMLTERVNMRTGRPCKPWSDEVLITDRRSCKKAIESWNDSCIESKNVSASEQERMFKAIQDPQSRPWNADIRWEGPHGECGHHTRVESPFNCEYGYNINFGNDVLIGRDCYMQDASLIIIKDRTIVGPNVKFYCMAASVDAEQRSGTRGVFMAGPIKVEEDVFIGADSIILPFRTIGKGSVVGAGSVVTRDVKPYTVVAGNPAKPVRNRKIEPGPNADRHNDDIQEQNDEMLRKLQNGELLSDHGR